MEEAAAPGCPRDAEEQHGARHTPVEGTRCGECAEVSFFIREYVRERSFYLGRVGVWCDGGGGQGAVQDFFFFFLKSRNIVLAFPRSCKIAVTSGVVD